MVLKKDDNHGDHGGHGVNGFFKERRDRSARCGRKLKNGKEQHMLTPYIEVKTTGEDINVLIHDAFPDVAVQSEEGGCLLTVNQFFQGMGTVGFGMEDRISQIVRELKGMKGVVSARPVTNLFQGPGASCTLG